MSLCIFIIWMIKSSMQQKLLVKRSFWIIMRSKMMSTMSKELFQDVHKPGIAWTAKTGRLFETIKSKTEWYKEKTEKVHMYKWYFGSR